MGEVNHKINGLGWYCLEIRSSRWVAMYDWYKNVLGCNSCIRDGNNYALLVLGELRISLIKREEIDQHQQQMSLAFDIEDIQQSAEVMAAKKIDYELNLDHPEGLKELLVTDPDGNRIRMFQW